jgi:hypothetical protein
VGGVDEDAIFVDVQIDLAQCGMAKAFGGLTRKSRVAGGEWHDAGVFLPPSGAEFTFPDSRFRCGP